MSKVFVVQENFRADYSDAERFGELVFMTASEFKPINGSLRNQAIKDDIKASLVRFTPDDFLVLTGNPTMIGFAFHHAVGAVANKGGVLNILQWDKIANGYKPFQITV
jgi:hypothetical protein